MKCEKLVDLKTLYFSEIMKVHHKLAKAEPTTKIEPACGIKDDSCQRTDVRQEVHHTG